MEIESDYQQLKEAWSRLSPLGKVIASAGIAMSALSISSLADDVFAFKGFLTKALELYRIFTDAVAYLVSWLINIQLSQAESDFAIFWILLSIAQLRAGLLTWESKGWVLSDRGAEGLHLLFSWLGFAFSIILLPVGVFLVRLSVRQWGSEIVQPIVITLLAIIPIWYFLKAKRIKKNKNGMFPEPGWHLESQIVALQLLAIYLLVGIVAAISEGLTRT